MTQQNNNKPIKNFRTGNIEASIWQNEVQKSGKTIVRHSVRIQKHYRKDDGSYENTDYFFPEDLPRLALVAQEAFRFLSLKEGLDAAQPPPA